MSHKAIKIGRAHDNDIILTHVSISRYHLEVFIDEQNNVFITDLNSRNGSFINGNQINGSVLLTKGDILRLGIDKPIQWHRWIENNPIDSGRDPKESSSGNSSPSSYPQYINTRKNNGRTIIYVLIIIGLMGGILFFINNNESKSQSLPIENVDASKSDSGNTKITVETTTPIGNNKPDQPKNISYDFSCLEDANDNNETVILNNGSDINDMVVDAFGTEVDMKQEVSYGNRLHKDLINKYEFITSGDKYMNLQNILNNLTSSINNPRGFNFQLYYIISDELNAFTAGGKIYITTTMYDFCNSSDELACIIGHEIFHNELGHIKYSIKQASMPGAEIMQLITTPFNQKKETACDLHGIDLAISAGYSGCACVDLWKRMKENQDNNNYDPLQNLFRSHPYSSKREDCSKHHIESNYNRSCN